MDREEGGRCELGEGMGSRAREATGEGAGRYPGRSGRRLYSATCALRRWCTRQAVPFVTVLHSSGNIPVSVLAPMSAKYLGLAFFLYFFHLFVFLALEFW